MLKLNAAYSKKVPAEGEFSSQSYHASIEIELADNLTSEQLNAKIHETFELVRNSVESELHGGSSTTANPANSIPQPHPPAGIRNVVPASPKQISYLLSLAQRRGVTPQQIATQCGVGSLEQLSKQQCSELINSWKAA